MENKESLKSLYNRIKFLTGLTQEEIAKRLKYERTYVSTVINSGEDNETMRQRMELTFAEELKPGFERLEDNLKVHEETEYQKLRRENKNKTSRKNPTPVFNVRAAAGRTILFNDRPELILEYVDIPFIGKADGVIEIVGASMNPTYVNGTRIAVRKLEDKELIYPGECYYVIDANYDGRVKRLFKSAKEDHIILRSDNKEYPDVELHWDKILAVCKILCRIIKN
jgi:hypothetical protein